VQVDLALLEGEYQEDGGRALTMLANHLQRISILVPDEALARLKQIGIWIERSRPRLKAMQYHPSRSWLVEHGHDPRLARKVHITQAQELLSRRQMLKHPAVILHELAHGYHDQFLGFDNPEIIAAYEQAMAAGTYENVLLYTRLLPVRAGGTPGPRQQQPWIRRVPAGGGSRSFTPGRRCVAALAPRLR